MSLLVSIKKDFGKFKLDVDYESEEGILGILGPSGSGKSMTLKCIAGIEKPDSGRIVLDGRVLFDSKENINLPIGERHIGYLFQDYGLFPNMTVQQNIMCGLHYEKNKDVKSKKTQEIIEKMRLTGLERHKPSQLSGGQQQRCALARILVNKPQLLMMDEPFSALDSYLRFQIESELMTVLKEFGKDVIMVSHNRDEIYRMCDNIAVMDAGNICRFGNVKEVFSKPENKTTAVLTGCKNIAGARKINENEICITDWNNITFSTEEKVRDGLTAIGIRAHYLKTSVDDNEIEVEGVECYEEPFEYTIKFRCRNGTDNYIWWRVSKDKWDNNMPDKLYVSKKDVMLLYN